VKNETTKNGRTEWTALLLEALSPTWSGVVTLSGVECVDPAIRGSDESWW